MKGEREKKSEERRREENPNPEPYRAHMITKKTTWRMDGVVPSRNGAASLLGLYLHCLYTAALGLLP